MKKVTVIGHFGFGEDLANGQTIKTKIITKELERQLTAEQVGKIDTVGGKNALVKLFFKSFSAMIHSKNIVILPAHNGLRFFAPILTFFNKFFKRKIFYVVIGGWLHEYLADKKKLAKKLKRFDGIFVETQTMKKHLESLDFSNIFVMPNCKELKVLKEEELVYPSDEPYKLCTFSRVCKEKGIEDAVNAVQSVNEKMGRVVYSLDIYGQVDKNQIEWFENLKSNFPEYITYGGLVDYDKSVDVLKNYFALLFPTYYEGEGFAGTILDAYAAGIPVVASDWKYNSEIVENNVSGFLFETKNIIKLENLLIELLTKADLIFAVKRNNVSLARSFQVENVVLGFIKKFGR